MGGLEAEKMIATKKNQSTREKQDDEEFPKNLDPMPTAQSVLAAAALVPASSPSPVPTAQKVFAAAALVLAPYLCILFLLFSALQVGKAIVQSKEGFYPSYESLSGAYVGILKQMQVQMEGEYKEAQEKEAMAAATLANMRTAKTAAIEDSENMAVRKEEELARTDNLVAVAKEVLAQVE